MTDVKQCGKCKETKSLTEFYKHKGKKDGFQPFCKSCVRLWVKQYREENKEKIAERTKQYREENKEKIAEYQKRRLMKNPTLRLRKNMSNHMRHVGGVAGFKHLPYTPKELREHIESLWEPWMNWDNYGPYQKHKRTWQVDHIIPQSHLICDSPHHPNFQKCWALSNLRPLCSLENRKKGDKLLTEELNE